MKQPLTIRAANRLGEAFRRRNRFPFPLEFEALLEKASKQTGLTDFGNPSFATGLNALLEELNSTARLSPLGQIAAYFNLLDYLCVRLSLIDYRKKREEVSQQAIKNPLFILGMPRSGTTFLYEMLAQDPHSRTPASWEVAIPVPPPTREIYDKDRRIRRVDIQFALAEKLSPGFKAIHAIGGALPQECVYLFASHFLSEQFGYMYNVPDYRSALLDADMADSYQWHAQFLQHLQVDFAAQRWVLKTPSHLAYLDALLAQYPDANIVWTHRSPHETVPSFCSLVSTLRRGFSNNVDPVDVGRFELRHQAKIVERGLTQLANVPTGQVLHVNYQNIVNKPMNVIEDIYAHFGMELTAQSATHMQTYCQQRPQGLYGKHEYRAGQFGLTISEIDAQFEQYLTVFETYLR